MKTILINGYTLSVSFEDGAIHLMSDNALWNLLSDNVKTNVEIVSNAILNEYKGIFGKALDISLKSLSVEILGHVYAEHILALVDRFIQKLNIDVDLKKIIRNCSVIDCGETDKDGNRWFWNMLTPIYDTIVAMLPSGTKFRQGGG
ncbi:hypothetical protein [Pollutibacter soli]|uniref:hypothetical protein n=1 Tax=Pollutibacter soli TaxID=3034157 RepID=UPI003013FFFD